MLGHDWTEAAVVVGIFVGCDAIKEITEPKPIKIRRLWAADSLKELTTDLKAPENWKLIQSN